MNIHDANKLLYTNTASSYIATTMDMVRDQLKPKKDEVYKMIDTLVSTFRGVVDTVLGARYPNLSKTERAAMTAAVTSLASGFMLADVFSGCATLVSMSDAEMDAANRAFKAAGASGVIRISKANVPLGVARQPAA